MTENNQQITTFQDAASILASRFCMKPLIIEGVLRDLNPNSPTKAAGQLVIMPHPDAHRLLIRNLWQISQEALEDAPWS